jgi:hypothetical protein
MSNTTRRRVSCRPLFVVVLAASCKVSGASDPPSPFDGMRESGVGATRFEQLCSSPLRVRLQSDSPVLSSVGSVDIDPKFGVLVTDPIEKRVFQFSFNGSALRTFGGPGTHPGEFRDLTDAVFIEQGRVLALDRHKGLTLYDKEGAVLRAQMGESFSGGTMLAHLSEHRIIVGAGNPGVLPSSPQYLVRVWALDSARPLSSFGQETWEHLRGFNLFRGVTVAADPSGTVVVVAVPYELGFGFFRPNGVQIGSWKGHLDEYLPPRPQARQFVNRSEADRWIISSSYLSAVSLLDSTSILFSWESYEGLRRHHHLALYSRSNNEIRSLGEVPYRFLRGIGDTLLFLDASLGPRYDVIACRGWSGGDNVIRRSQVGSLR